MSIPQPLGALLDAVVPADAKERADLATLRAKSTTLADPFSRDQPEAHFTGSALVTDGSRVALVFHRKLSRWLQPGGHAEKEDGGDLARTALREALEETGLSVRLQPTAPKPFDVDVHEIPARSGAPAHLHLDVRFLALADASADLAGDVGEVSATRWFTLSEALAVADDPSLRRLLAKAERHLLSSQAVTSR
jgi:8-oxo-dGTP pyrophosphatase MutT (NUDIX family)